MKENIMTINKEGVKSPYPDNTIIESSQFITGSDLADYFQITDGFLINNDTDWYSKVIDDKYLIVPLLPIRYGLGWGQLYQKGLVYGVNGNGKFPSGTPTNQLRTIKIDDRIYKVRLLRGANIDPTPQLRGSSLSGTSNSEFNKIFMPISAESTPLYTGPKLANYSTAELGFNSGQGSWTFCIESETTNTNLATARGYSSVNRVDGSTKSLTNINTIGWRPCLEYII